MLDDTTKPEAAAVTASQPTLWAKYSEQDVADARRVNAWLAEPGRNLSEIKFARAVGGSQTTVNQILTGRYPSPPRKHLDAMLAYIERESNRAADMIEPPFVATSVYKLASLVCRKAHEGRDFGVLSGEVGVGKTRALKEYAARNAASTLYLRGSPDMNPRLLMLALVEATGAVVEKTNKYSNGTKSDMLRAVTQWFAGRDYLLIFDEADKVQEGCLEYIRTIVDEAEIGCVLSGTERLRPMVENEHGRHGQISSRVGFWPSVIRSITREDSDLIAGEALGVNDADVLDACWEMCSGKARVLGKLLRNVHHARKGGTHELTGHLVIQAGQQLMGLKRDRSLTRGVR